MDQSAPEKRPRQYAADIIALSDKQQRVVALSQVPEQYRDWVRELVSDHFARRKARNKINKTADKKVHHGHR
ncbi:MAG: hypothetical protein OEW08_09095 [Gammaproteobacteria bacterium]|nr:hypothetical protein [Gammaproteobacteria bacterium]